MERKAFLKRERKRYFFFILKQLALNILFVVLACLSGFIGNSLVSVIIILTISFWNYLVLSEPYKDFDLYKSLFYRNRLEHNLIVYVIVVCVSSYIIMRLLNEEFYEWFAEKKFFSDEFEFQRSLSISLTFPIGLIAMIINFLSISKKLDLIIHGGIFDSSYYFNLIKNRQSTYFEIKERLISKSSDLNFWYSSLENKRLIEENN
ncbi:hypothetical protein [uncultured Algoriphagus sp.]|uniref:hypothetical protein n=1 Tax=uncultured Algoriphagus sp. TaxID=417365 RepID=UPI002582D878|nr:hypothetical protein [uncultured Algoriphagus sp.]